MPNRSTDITDVPRDLAAALNLEPNRAYLLYNRSRNVIFVGDFDRAADAVPEDSFPIGPGETRRLPAISPVGATYGMCQPGEQARLTVNEDRESQGPYGDKRIVNIGADDYVNDSGFTCEISVEGGGSLTYRTLDGDEDLTASGLSAGDTITGPGGVPVRLRAIRGASTVTRVEIGLL